MRYLERHFTASYYKFEQKIHVLPMHYEIVDCNKRATPRLEDIASIWRPVLRALMYRKTKVSPKPKRTETRPIETPLRMGMAP